MDCRDQNQVQDCWDMYFKDIGLENINYDDIDIMLPPPEKEPFRQYYFIAKDRYYLQQLEEQAGRKLMFTLRSFGCQMNAQFGNL